MNDKEVLEKIKTYFGKNDDVVTVYLFGSRVKDCARQTSDLDLAVLFRENMDSIQRFEQKLQIANELEDLVETKIDLVDLKSADLFFIYQIMKNKVILLDKDTSSRVSFEVNNRKRYFDFMRYYHQYRRLAMKRLKER